MLALFGIYQNITQSFFIIQIGVYGIDPPEITQ